MTKKKILILNGSPRGEKSNTLKLARAFSRGMEEESSFVTEEVVLSDKTIGHCRGCFACWAKTPGRCVINDDMTELLEKYIGADGVIWSLPLYYFSMPSLIKAFMDRLLPLNEPWIEAREDGSSSHPSRCDLSRQDQILIATCGFPSRRNNFEALEKQFDILAGESGRNRSMFKILCPEGELFSEKTLQGRTSQYLDHVEQAGREYARTGRVTEETRAELEELLYPAETFLEMANNSWDISAGEKSYDIPDNRAEQFLRQMAAVYNRGNLDKTIVLEMYFTDLNQQFQLHMNPNKCTVMPKGNGPFTTRIETPFSVWLDISEKKINGARAMMDGLYKVTGDFDTMNRMDDLFGTGNAPSPAKGVERKNNMTLLLLPWIALWVFLPMDNLASLGGAAAIALCALVSLAGFRFTLTPYDRITALLVTILGLTALSGLTAPWLISLSYLLFGLMWTISARLAVPLTAWYSSREYGGEAAFTNPLFMKTNRILTDCWGILYLVTALTSYLLMQSPLKPYTGLINQAGPVIMGLFTVWFQKWYPAYVARGGRKKKPTAPRRKQPA